MVAAKLFEANSGRQRVDRYELIGEIASGGMATVYLARLTGVGGFQRFVAMKRLHPHLAGENEFVEMFLDEARLAAGIHHPNVVPILEVGASPVGYYLVMEYIEGDTLARMLARAASKNAKVPLPIVLRVMIDTLAGLNAAHELRDDHGDPVNLVHRDVSPQNVLVGADGIARITDFGVARAASRLSATRVGQLKGKIAYMAPEQASGNEQIDRRADVFSSGVVVWEALAGRRLFKAENEAATLSRVISEKVPDLTPLVPGISPELAAVVARALERDVDKRFASCAQFADALEAAATQRDGIAMSRELASYVREVMGQEIEAQRDAVRAWLARSEPSQAGAHEIPSAAVPSSSVSAAAMFIPGDERSKNLTQPTLSTTLEPPRSRAPLVIGTLLLLVLVGVGGFVVARTTHSVPAAAPGSSPTLAAVTASASPSAAASAAAAPDASSSPALSPEALSLEATAAATRRRLASPPPSSKPPPARPPKKPKSGGLDISNPYR